MDAQPAKNHSSSRNKVVEMHLAAASTGPARPLLARLAAHAVGAVLCLTALFFILWFWRTNPALVRIFPWLFKPWGLGGGDFDFTAMAWALLAVGVMTVIGWFYLEGLELYLPRGAIMPLAYIFGLGLAGFVFECLAIPYALSRTTIASGLGLLLLLLAIRAWWRGRRLPESGMGGDAGLQEQLMRRTLARQTYEASLVRPAGAGGRLFRRLALFLIGAITFFNFWHALLYPEVYWDSLILYMGYARMTFLEGGFPVKVTGQVGIGLGANYPHLFAVLGSAVCTAAGQWSELPQRLMTPLAGLATTMLIYQTVLRMTRHVNFALAMALLYRAIPLGIAYDQMASDYALALLFGAAFLYLALLYIDTALRGYLAAVTLLIGLAMHLNYLMGIFWGPWAVMILATHVGRPSPHDWTLGHPEPQAPWTALLRRPSLGAVLRSGRFWAIVIGAGVIGSTWYIRNWIVTGNPVYAFFSGILDGKNVNPEVMKAAAIEWQANGAGIGRQGATLAQRIMATWAYFTGVGPDYTWGQAFRLSPVLMGFTLGGLTVWLGRLIVSPFCAGRSRGPWDPPLRIGLVTATLFLGLLAFHYLLAPYYLYQIIDILPCMAVLAALAWPWWRLRPWALTLALLVLVTGLVPGLAMSMMGFKVTGPFKVAGEEMASPLDLYPLRHPLPSETRFYRWRYGDEPLMWNYINHNLKGKKLLTHENRDLVFDPSITLVNLDDWDIQPLWDLPTDADRVRELIKKGIEWYLFVPNELACPTNARMGTARWEAEGLDKLVFSAGETRLYRLIAPGDDAATTATTATQPAEQATPAPAPADAPTTATQ